MGNVKKYELQECDKQLFERMKKEAVSENERRFFKEMEYRQQYHLTAQDNLLDFFNTEAKIGFYRFDTGWYMLEIDYWDRNNGYAVEYECLYDFLFDEWKNHKQIKSTFKNMLEYLRSIDYEGINYHADQDWD